MKSGFDRIGHTVTVEHAKRSCLDKVRYPSRNAARDRATHIANNHPNTASRSARTAARSAATSTSRPRCRTA